MNKNNIYKKYKHFYTSAKYRFNTMSNGTFYILSNKDSLFVIIHSSVWRYATEVISGRLIGKYPLSLEERIEEARKKLSKMNKADKWKLVHKSFGMWEDYPEDWLERVRKGTWVHDYIRDTNESDNFFSC